MAEYALGYIESLERFGVKPGLSRIAALCTRLGHPQNKLRFVHVAGTNGKGSTCAMLAEICRLSGYRTGLYVSPFVYEFTERMQVNNQKIPMDTLERLTETVRQAAESLSEAVTEFEFITALAFCWFAEQHCDVVILETGLGGRLDATNCIEKPLCSVLTKIALDHTAVLGNSIAAIAREKCGIIKQGCPVVSCCEQPQEALQIIRQFTIEKTCMLLVADELRLKILQTGWNGSKIEIDNHAYSLRLGGAHMCRNALTAVLAASTLKQTALNNITEEAIAQGLAVAYMPGRMEILQTDPIVLFDGGHNPDCGQALRAALDAQTHGPICAICGLLQDKDGGAYLDAVLPAFAHVIVCAPNSPRAMLTQNMLALVQTKNPANGFSESAEGFAQAYAIAQTYVSQHPGAMLLVCGSFYFGGALREAIYRQ
jgi:dihydrofolate synthase/folylpolyglutamate synthase